MKKLLNLFLLAFLMIGVASCNKAQTSFSINGEISGLKDGAKLILVYGATHKDEKPFAEAAVKNGKFQFTGKVDEPRLCYLMVEDTYGVINLMVENAYISVKAVAVASEFDAKTNYDYKSVQIAGSKLQQLYLQKTAFHDALNDLYIKNEEKHKDYFNAVGNARKNNNQTLLDSLEASSEGKSAAADESAFFKEVEEKTTKAILADKDSWWGPLLMLINFNYFTKEQIPLYSQFSQEAKNSYYGKLIHEELYPKNLISQAAPAFTLNDKDGNPFNSTDLMNGKKYVLIDFWASWCNPCRKEIPNVKRMYELYALKGLQIISISIDKDKAAWLKALETEKMPWPNLLNTDSTADKYYVKAVPALFLLNDKGVVMSDTLRGESLAKKLEELFK